jgi:hypothetical protein
MVLANPNYVTAEAREDYLTSSQLFQQAKGFKGRGGSTTARLDGELNFCQLSVFAIKHCSQTHKCQLTTPFHQVFMCKFILLWYEHYPCCHYQEPSSLRAMQR